MRQKNVLLVEDDLDVLSTLDIILSNSGFNVMCAHDARTAKNALTLIDHPEFVILDYAISGLDSELFVKDLKKSFPDTKIILASGYSEELIKKECSLECVDMFIAKPFNPSVLLYEMKELDGLKEIKKKETGLN
jgi:DNA-binding response OmpR family regulator